jgi:uncharacterized protein (DUF433 family)
MSTTWQYLAPNPKSSYRQLFVRGTRLRAEVLYGWTVDGSQPLTPEEVAESFHVPLEAVLEAIAYCQSNPPEIDHDRAAEEALLRASGIDPVTYRGTPRLLSAQEIHELRQS